MVLGSPTCDTMDLLRHSSPWRHKRVPIGFATASTVFSQTLHSKPHSPPLLSFETVVSHQGPYTCSSMLDATHLFSVFTNDLFCPVIQIHSHKANCPEYEYSGSYICFRLSDFSPSSTTAVKTVWYAHSSIFCEYSLAFSFFLCSSSSHLPMQMAFAQ